MSFKVIGIIGMAGHGKDTAAEYFVREHGYVRIALADRLKEEVAELFDGFPEAQLEQTMHGEKSPIVRRILQVWGTEGRRVIDRRWWLKEWAVKAVRAATEGAGGVVISDVRFPNEVDFVKEECGGALVFVDRGDFRMPGVDYTHASERYIPDLKGRSDYVVPNTATIGDLDIHLRVVAGEILRGNCLS